MPRSGCGVKLKLTVVRYHARDETNAKPSILVRDFVSRHGKPAR
jgi:hypothetical protein